MFSDGVNTSCSISPRAEKIGEWNRDFSAVHVNVGSVPIFDGVPGLLEMACQVLAEKMGMFTEEVRPVFDTEDYLTEEEREQSKHDDEMAEGLSEFRFL